MLPRANWVLFLCLFECVWLFLKKKKLLTISSALLGGVGVIPHSADPGSTPVRDCRRFVPLRHEYLIDNVEEMRAIYQKRSTHEANTEEAWYRF